MYTVSGTVTYRGKPVAIGTVMFYPDSSRGNFGKVVSAVVKDGRYELRPSAEAQASFGGAYLVVIQGYDGKPGGETTYGNPIFPSYKAEVDLPNEDVTKDFTIPLM